MALFLVCQPLLPLSSDRMTRSCGGRFCVGILRRVGISICRGICSGGPGIVSFLRIVVVYVRPICTAVVGAVHECCTSKSRTTTRGLGGRLPYFAPTNAFGKTRTVGRFLLPDRVIKLSCSRMGGHLRIVRHYTTSPRAMTTVRDPASNIGIFTCMRSVRNHRHRNRRLIDHCCGRLLNLRDSPTYGSRDHLYCFDCSPGKCITDLCRTFALRPLVEGRRGSSSRGRGLPPFPLRGGPARGASRSRVGGFVSSCVFLRPLAAKRHRSGIFGLTYRTYHHRCPRRDVLYKLAIFFRRASFHTRRLADMLSSNCGRIGGRASTAIPPTCSPYRGSVEAGIPCNALRGSSDARRTC